MELKALQDANLFMNESLKKRNIVIDKKGLIIQEKAGIDTNILASYIWVDYQQALNEIYEKNVLLKKSGDNNQIKIKRFDYKTLQCSITATIQDVKIKSRRELIEKMKFSGSHDDLEIKKLLESLTGEVRDLDLAVLKHFMWNTKRKMNGLPARWQIMPVFYSHVQGTGKSEACKNLMKPLDPFITNSDLRGLTDERALAGLADNYIVFCDEMSGTEKTVIEALKNIITSENFSYRPMGTNTRVDIPNTLSFLATSNKPVDECIFDSGMRRFYQINILNEKATSEALGYRESLNYLEMWQNIDENNEKGYTPEHFEALSKVQGEMETVGQIETFVEDCGFLDKEIELVETSMELVYAVYTKWALLNGFNPLNNGWFGRKLKNLGIQHFRKQEYGQRKTFLMAPKNLVGV